MSTVAFHLQYSRKLYSTIGKLCSDPRAKYQGLKEEEIPQMVLKTGQRPCKWVEERFALESERDAEMCLRGVRLGFCGMQGSTVWSEKLGHSS